MGRGGELLELSPSNASSPSKKARQPGAANIAAGLHEEYQIETAGQNPKKMVSPANLSNALNQNIDGMPIDQAVSTNNFKNNDVDQNYYSIHDKPNPVKI